MSPSSFEILGLSVCSGGLSVLVPKRQLVRMVWLLGSSRRSIAAFNLRYVTSFASFTALYTPSDDSSSDSPDSSNDATIAICVTEVTTPEEICFAPTPLLSETPMMSPDVMACAGRG